MYDSYVFKTYTHLPTVSGFHYGSSHNKVIDYTRIYCYHTTKIKPSKRHTTKGNI